MGIFKKALSLLSAIFLAVGLIGCQTEVPSSVGIDANGDGVVDCQVAVATNDSSVTLTAGEGCQDTAAAPATPAEPTPPPATVSGDNVTLTEGGLQVVVLTDESGNLRVYDAAGQETAVPLSVSNDWWGQWNVEGQEPVYSALTQKDGVYTLLFSGAAGTGHVSLHYSVPGQASVTLYPVVIGLGDGITEVTVDGDTLWQIGPSAGGSGSDSGSGGDDSGNGNVAATFIMNGNGVGEYSTYFTVTVTDAEGLLGALNAPLPECDALDVRLGFLNYDGPVGGNAVVPGWDDEVSAVVFNGSGQYIIPGIPENFRGGFIMYCATKVSAATWRDDIRYVITNDPAIAISGPRVVEDPNNPGSFIVELADGAT